MILSIITINYNNATRLEKTIHSVTSQTYPSFEYIVIDGGSTDGSKEIIEKFADKISYWVSEPDKGIYNAMNKGIKAAKGEYLLFINSGDTLYNETVLENVFQQQQNADLIYGDLHRIFPDGHTDVAYMPERIDIQQMLGATLAHPVTFIKRYLFDKYDLYREDLKIVSDWAFFLKIIAFGRISQKHIPLIISTFYMDGLSSHEESIEVIKTEREKVITESFSYELLEIYNLYERYRNFYDKKIFRIIRRIKGWVNYFKKPKNWKEYAHIHRIQPLIWILNKTVRAQKKDTSTIPIIIINYNRLEYLKELVDSLIRLNHKHIVIIDNKSSYPPLLAYYKSIQDKATIEYMDDNHGHLAFWIVQELFDKYSSGYYVITDSDVIPNPQLSAGYLKKMVKILDRNKDVTKVGFALDISDIPDYYQQKQSVLNWEQQHWDKEIGTDLFSANIDTTFALYPPQYRYKLEKLKEFYKGIRIGGIYTAKHMGWYIDNDNLSEEEKYYFKTADTCSSWRLDENGNFAGNSEYK